MDIVFVLLGFIAGYIVKSAIRRNKTLGTLEIDMTDEEQPYYRLLMTNEEFGEIPKHSYVTFRVNSKSKFTRVTNNDFNETY